jgi:YD repeat-containing protein
VTLLTNHPAGHLLAEARGGVLVTNGYDGFFRRTRLRLAVPLWNDTVTYGHDAASRLRGVTNGGYATEYQYLPGSSQVGVALGWELSAPGAPAVRLRTERVPDGLDRVAALDHFLGNHPAPLAARYGTGYNLAGQRHSLTNADGTRWDYEYDGLGQLFRARREWLEGPLLDNPFVGQQFEYLHDDIGNRTRAATGGLDFFPLREYYTPNAMNQLTQRTVQPYARLAGRAAGNATVTVNFQEAQRHGPGLEWFHHETFADNSTGAVWLGLTNVAT